MTGGSAPGTPGGIAGVFDRSADTYDAVGVDWFRPIGRGLVGQLDPRPGERALDIGCGRGAVLIPLAAAVGPDGHVLGVDLAPRMVAATAADVAHLPHVKVAVGDATALELRPSTFDVVASSLVLFFLPDPAAALRSWLELLVPGGRIGVATFGAVDERWKAVDALFTPYLPPSMMDARTSGASGPFASDGGMEALLADAGAVDVRTVRSTVEPSFDGPEHWLTFSWSHGQRAMWEAVPPADRAVVERSAFALLDGFREPDRRITFTQTVRYTLGRRPRS